MRLVFFELKKALGSGILVLFLLFCAIACGLVSYTESTRDDTYFYLQKIEEDYLKDPEALRTYFEETLMPLSTDFERLLRAYYRGEISEEPIRSLPCTYSGDEKYNDYDLIRNFFVQRGAEETWKKQIEKTIERAEITKEDLLVFYVNLDEDSFAYRQQDLISRLYTDVLDRTDLEAKGYGWDQLFSFDAVNIFIYLSISAGAMAVFLNDIGKSALVLRVSKKGRGQTAIAKIAVLLCWSVLSAVLVCLMAGVGVYLKCGAYSDAFAPMASFFDYQFMPYCFSVLEYLLVFLGAKILLACTVAMFCAIACLLLRNVSLAFLTSAALMTICFLLFRFAQADALKYLNFYGIGCFGALTNSFRCVNVFRTPLPILPVAVALLVLLFFLSTAAVFLLFQKSRLANALHFLNFGRFKKAETCAPCSFGKRAKEKNYGTELLFYEFRKTFMTRSAAFLLLVVFFLKIVVSSGTYDYRSGFKRPFYEDYMAVLAGENTDLKRKYIESEYAFVTERIGLESKLRSDFLQGKLEPQAYHDFLEEFRYAQDRKDLIERIRIHSEYLDQTKEKTGISAHFLFETDWIRLFQAGSDVLLMAYLVYVFSGVFADEYVKSSGKSQGLAMTKTTKNGRGTLFWKKLVFVILVSVTAVALFCLIDGIFIWKNFTLPAKDAPLLSLEIFGNAATSVSLRELLVIAVMVKTAGAVLLSLLSAMPAVLIKNKFYTLTASFSLAFLPEILAFFGVKQASYFSFANVFHPSKWLVIGASLDRFGDWGYVFLFFAFATLATVLITAFARKEYCK